MSATDFRIDTRDMERKMRRLLKVVAPEAIRKGVGKASLQCLNDCVTIAPTVPEKEGTLRGSGSVHVEGQFAGKSENRGGTGAPNMGQEKKEHATGLIGWNSPYAGFQHEGKRLDGSHVVKNYTEPSSGRKFLLAKLISRRRFYMSIIANTLRASMNRGR